MNGPSLDLSPLLLEPLASPLDGRDDRSEVLGLKRVGSGLMHVPHCRAEIVEGPLAIQLPQALDRTLKA